MENKGYQRKYYEAQSSNNWDRQKVEFELKIEELRQAKTELVGQKFAMLSPKRQVLVQNKTFEEMQALLVLKEEENAVLGTLLASEREKARNLLGESQLLKIQNLDLESKLKICEGQLKDLEKSMASYFNNMTVLKTNVSKWLGSPTNSNTKSVSGLSSPKYDSQLSMHRSEIQELKSKLSELQKSYENTLKELKTKEEKESDNLLNYLTSARNSEKPKAFEESLQGELDKKTKELLAIQEDFEITEQQYKQTISDLSKENAKHKSLILNLETQLKSESWGKRSTPHSYTNSKNFEEYENNLKILTENYKLLQDRIKIMESEKIKIIQDFKAERKFTANELAKAILSGYSNNDQQKRLIEENLCKLWLAYENIFSVFYS